MTKRYKSDAFAAIHDTAKGLHEAGAINAAKMRKYDKTCLAGETATAAVRRPPARKAMSFHVFKDDGGQWRWRLQSPNGRSIASSGEAYKNKKDCLSAIDLVKHAGHAEVVS
jgi:uncharacterized protein YegP (UPF0339 family)